MKTSLKEKIEKTFYEGSALNFSLVIVFVTVNGIVLLNAVLHEPTIGYDAPQHFGYFETLAQFRLPTRADTREFFCPPLPYIFPAALVGFTAMDVWWAGKLAQIFNFLLSAGLTWYVIRLCHLIRPGDALFKTVSLAALGMLPVYYKTFSFIRGEPFVAFFAVFAVYQLLSVLLSLEFNRSRVILAGVGLGLLVLSRQWGILLFPAILVFGARLAIRKRRDAWNKLLKPLIAVLTISFVVGSWFYLILLWRHGSITAFNMRPDPRPITSTQPRDFFLGTGSGKLFSQPIRDEFPNQLFPVFYSEIWGDYWGYFLVYGRNPETGVYVRGAPLARDGLMGPLETNRTTIGSYLGRVNLFALIPSAVLLGGLVNGLFHLTRFIRRRNSGSNPDETQSDDREAESPALSLLVLIVFSSLTGYFWFLLRYPEVEMGGTIKASYMLHIFPFLGVLSGELLMRLNRQSPRLFSALAILLAVIFIHNLKAVITHYIN